MKTTLTVIFDLAFVCGVAAIVRGAWLAWPPAAWLIGGGMLALWAIGGTKRLDNKQRGAST